MLGVILEITPVLSSAAQVKIHFHPDAALGNAMAAPRPEHIICFLALSAAICVHLRLINRYS